MPELAFTKSAALSLGVRPTRIMVNTPACSLAAHRDGQERRAIVAFDVVGDQPDGAADADRDHRPVAQHALEVAGDGDRKRLALLLRRLHGRDDDGLVQPEPACDIELEVGVRRCLRVDADLDDSGPPRLCQEARYLDA